MSTHNIPNLSNRIDSLVDDLDTTATKVTSIDGKFTTLNAKDFSTATLQTSANSKLDTIHTDLGTTLNNQLTSLNTTASGISSESTLTSLSNKIPSGLSVTSNNLNVSVNSIPTTSITNTDTASLHRNLDVGTTSSQIGSTSAVKLHSILIQNTTSSDTRYLKLYNSASATESATPVMTVLLPPQSTMFFIHNVPIRFSTALCVRGTTGLLDNDTGAPNTNDITINVSYSQ